MDSFHERLVAGRAPAVALSEAQASVRGLTARDLEARYTALGGTTAKRSVRRGPPMSATRDLALDPALVDGPLAPEGPLERTWAPFVLVGG